MKFPKELQKAKKGNNSKEKESNFAGSLIQTFKKQFEELKDNFNDKRRLDYIFEIDKVTNKTSNRPRLLIVKEVLSLNVFRG